MYAAAGQCFCYLIITVLIRFSEKPGYSGSEQVASASVAFFFLYYVFFGIGFQGVPWLYVSVSNWKHESWLTVRTANRDQWPSDAIEGSGPGYRN